MPILFVGGEEGDMLKSSTACSMSTNTSNRRTAYTRAAMKIASYSISDGWYGKFSGSATSFWASARFSYDSTFYNPALNGRPFGLCDGVNVRLYVGPNTGTTSEIQTKPIALWKMDAAGNKTVLVTSTTLWPMWNVVSKLDVQVVNYGTNATVRVYLEGVLVIQYQGDVTTDGSTSLDGIRLSSMASVADGMYWSEVIVSTTDTRALTLATLAPAAAGNTYNWTNAVTAINETSLDDTTICYTNAANQLLEATITNTTIPGTCGVVSVFVNARAQKGNTSGPANANMVVRTGGADYTSASIALPSAFSLIQANWDTNPATGAAWVPTDLTAAGFNIGIKSLT